MNCNPFRHPRFICCSAALALLWIASQANGQTTWTNPGADDWFTGTNWSAGVPTAGGNAIINNGGTAQIGAAGAVAQSLIIGDSAIGNLTLSAGSLSNVSTLIGGAVGSTGIATVTGGTWANSSGLFVGNSGTGTLNLSGGTVSAASVTVGEFGTGIGTINLNGGVLATGQVSEGAGNGTVTFNGGTLRLTGNQPNLFAGFEAGDVTLVGAGGTIDTQTFTVASAYGLSGNGPLTKQGNGTLTLTGTNTYSGLTTVSGGTLTIQNAAALGTNAAGTVVANGAALRMEGGITVAGEALTMSGQGISNTGALVSGTGNNTWTGAITLDSNSRIQTVLGSSLALHGGITAVDFNLLMGGGGNTLIDGVIALGNGSLTKQGAAGTLTLTGANTYTGGTTVSAGTLLANNTAGSATGTGLVNVASGATLGGNGRIGGSVNVASGGIFSPGNNTGILTVGPLTLQSGSTTRMEINGTTPGTGHDQIWVNGIATLNGTLDLLFGFVPVVGNSFTLIQANSFTLAGNAATGFSDIQTNLGAALLANVVINSTTFNIEIALSQKDFVPFAGTPNQRAVARNLDLFSTTGEDQPLIDFVNTLLAGQLPGAFDQIAPEELALLGEMGFANSRDIFRILNNRGNEIQNSQQFSNNGLGFWDSGKEFQQNLFAGSGDPVAGGQLFVPKADDRRLGFFVSGQGTFGDYDGDGNGDSYDFSTGGMILGGDYRLTENAAVGLYAGYQGSEANTSASSKIGSDSAKFGAYGTWWHEKGSWVSANIGGGAHSYDSDRVSLGGNATGSTNGTEINTHLALGQNFKAGKNKEWTFGPEAELGYTHLWIDGFTESGSLAPLSIEDRDADSLRSTLAAKVSYDWKIQTWTLRPYARVGWQHEFMDDNGSVNARLASGAGNFFTVQGSDIARDSVVAGAGAQLLFSDAISALLGYSAEANSDYEIHSINGSVNFRF